MPARDERLDRVRDHRPVVDRQQVLVRDPRERMESAAGASGEDDALHVRGIVREELCGEQSGSQARSTLGA